LGERGGMYTRGGMLLVFQEAQRKGWLIKRGEKTQENDEVNFSFLEIQK